MPIFLLGPVRGVLSLTRYALNSIFWCTFLFMVALLKFIVPFKPWRRLCDMGLTCISNSWIYCNNLNVRLTNPIRWDTEGLEGLRMNQWYLVVANHQSWVDILVLQKVFFRKIPFLKFFLKKELIWVPFLGLAWWALDSAIPRPNSRMGDRISRILNVTIAYPPGPKSYWAFLCGKIGEVKVRVESLPVTKELLGDYLSDGQYRRRLQLWLNELWREKDLLLANLHVPVLAEAETARPGLPGGREPRLH